jgi:CxxC-x17-CxxC domain-containing protein
MHPRRTNEAPRKPSVEVTCSACGEKAKVPFKPTEGRPVLCKRCFEAGVTIEGANQRGVPRPEGEPPRAPRNDGARRAPPSAGRAGQKARPAPAGRSKGPPPDRAPKPAAGPIRVALHITCSRCGKEETVASAPRKRSRAMCRDCCLEVFGPAWEGWRHDPNPPKVTVTCRSCSRQFEVNASSDPPVLCRDCVQGVESPHPARVEGGAILDAAAGVKRKRG